MRFQTQVSQPPTRHLAASYRDREAAMFAEYEAATAGGE